MAAASVAIIGGGISGLSTAYFLAQSGIRSTLIEKSGRLGGLIKTDMVEGCELEAGPDSYIATKPAVTDLSRELPGCTEGSLHDEIIGSNDAQRRVLIARHGHLQALPKGMVMMAPAEWKPMLTSNLLSWRTKLRYLQETMAGRRGREEDVSIAQLVMDHFGTEVLEYVAEPLLSGVYGGLAGQLSAKSVLPRFLDYERHYGSIVRGVRQERRAHPSGGSMFLSFRIGMQALVDSLARAVQDSCAVLYSTEATRIERSNGRWRIRTGIEAVEADHLVIACAAHRAAALLDRELPDLCSELEAIPYSSAVLVSLVYETERLAHPLDAFGFLVPGAERNTIAACTCIGVKFPSRIPHGQSAYRSFIVEPEATTLLSAPPEEVIGRVAADLKRLAGIDSPARLSNVHYWPSSMPQYVLGHEARRKRIVDLEAECPNLYLVGNWFSGVGIPDCVKMAKETAKRIHFRYGSVT